METLEALWKRLSAVVAGGCVCGGRIEVAEEIGVDCGASGAVPVRRALVARCLDCDVMIAQEVLADARWGTEMPFMAVAEDVADKRRSLSSTRSENWSTSQRCILALLAGEPEAAEPPYNESPAAAWGRLDHRQRALVERLAPDVIARYSLRR